MTRLQAKVARLVDSAAKLAAVEAEASRLFDERFARIIRSGIIPTAQALREIQQLCNYMARRTVEAQEE